MKTNLLIETQNPGQIELLLRVAREMGISIVLLNDAHEKLSEAEEEKLWQSLAQKEMEQDWQHADNDHWDAFIASKLAA